MQLFHFKKGYLWITDQVTKEKLIKTIKGIEDQSILDDINRLLEIEMGDELFHTSTAQQERIQKAKHQIQNGEVVHSTKADKDIDEWLGELFGLGKRSKSARRFWHFGLNTSNPRPTARNSTEFSFHGSVYWLKDQPLAAKPISQMFE